MNLTCRYFFAASLLVSAVSPVFAQASSNSVTQDCDLTQAMGQARIEAQNRRIEATQVGIIESNQSVIESLPTISQGACTSQIYDMMRTVQGKIQSSIGSIISSVVGNQIASMINNMTCAEAERFYRQVMSQKVLEIDDRFGIFSSGGQIIGYNEGRTSTIDIERAIELGRQAADVAKTVPTAPPGRAPASTGAPESSNEVRSAVNAL